jgi:hypothetical protein
MLASHSHNTAESLLTPGPPCQCQQILSNVLGPGCSCSDCVCLVLLIVALFKTLQKQHHRPVP